MSTQKINLDDAYAVVTPQDNRELYAKWAETYETTFVEANQYRYPRALAEHFASTVPSTIGTRYVDVGCGTGIVGLNLTRLRGDALVDGMDISPEMLDQASKKTRADGSPVYTRLIEVDLTVPNSFPTFEYDAMLSAGTFTHGHLGPNVLPTLIKLVRVGGWFVIGINAEHFALRGFDVTLEQMVADGQICQPATIKVHVYEPGSPHFGDQAVLATFARL